MPNGGKQKIQFRLKSYERLLRIHTLPRIGGLLSEVTEVHQQGGRAVPHRAT